MRIYAMWHVPQANHSAMIGICLVVSCAGYTGFFNKSFVLLQETIRYSTLPLHIVKVRSLLLVYRLIVGMQ